MIKSSSFFSEDRYIRLSCFLSVSRFFFLCSLMIFFEMSRKEEVKEDAVISSFSFSPHSAEYWSWLSIDIEMNCWRRRRMRPLLRLLLFSAYRRRSTTKKKNLFSYYHYTHTHLLLDKSVAFFSPSFSFFVSIFLFFFFASSLLSNVHVQPATPSSKRSLAPSLTTHAYKDMHSVLSCSR